MAGSEIEQLVKMLSRLPGLGPRSSRRVVLSLLDRRDVLLRPLIVALQHADKAVAVCGNCGNLDATDPCSLCVSEKRDPSQLCVVEDVASLWALERARVFSGQYHVLGGVLSPLDGTGPDDLSIPKLLNRAGDSLVSEVILALSATVEGQTTAHYLTDKLVDSGVAITRLAHGVPIGGELDYLDDGTLGAALQARRPI